MCEAKEEEDWCVEDPNEEWFNPMKWRKGTWMPEGKVILELFERLKKEKILELKWKCPGRRPPESERQEEEMETTEKPDNDHEEEEKQDEKPTSFGEFEFDDAPSEASTKITPRRTPGTGKSPRPQKRVARMDNILNDIMRQRKQNQAARANKTLGLKARRSPIYSNAASPKSRLGLSTAPGSSAPKPPTTDPFSSSVFSASSTSTSTAPTSSTVAMDTTQPGSKEYSVRGAPTSAVTPVSVSSPGVNKSSHPPMPPQTHENWATVPPFNPGSALSSASVSPGTPTVGSVKANMAKIQSNFTRASPPVSHADQSRVKTPPSSQSGPLAPQTVPKLLLKIPPSNQHPFISNKSEQLGFSPGRKTPPVSQTGQRTTPSLHQNPSKTSPANPKSPKTPPAHYNVMQSAPKGSTAYQNASKTSLVYQAAPKTPPVYQNAPKTPPVYHSAPKTPPSYHTAPKTPPVCQNAPKTPPVYLYAPKTPPAYQNAPKTPPAHQNAPKTPPTFQNAPKTPPVSQASSKALPSFQNAPKTPPSYQNVPNMSPPYHAGPKTPPSYQNAIKTPTTYQNNSRTPSSYQNTSKTPPPYHTVVSRGPPTSAGISATRTSSPLMRPAYSSLGGSRPSMGAGHFMGNVPGMGLMMSTNPGMPRTLPPGMRPPPAHAAVSMAPGENFQRTPGGLNNLARSPNPGQVSRPPPSSPSGTGIASTVASSIQGPQPGIRGHPSGKTQPSGVTSGSREAT